MLLTTNNDKHNNTYLLQAWNKYGENNFIFTIIERCSKNELNQKEIYWIDKLDSHKSGYNLTDGGDGCLGRIYTEQQIKDKCYPILQLDLNGNFIERWDRAQDASDALNICCRAIQGAAGPNVKHKTAGGFIWVYEKDYVDFVITDRIDSKKSAVKQYSRTWDYIRSYDSMSLAEKDGYSTSNISAVCRGISKQAYGYIWVYDSVNIESYIPWYNDHFDITYIG